MKKKKSFLLLIILLLVVVTGGAATLTYSRYLSTAEGSSTATVAPWVVKVNGDDIVANNTFTGNDIIWSESTYISDGYIAPSRTGTFDIVIDPTGAKVAMQYTIELDKTNITNNNITISSVKLGDTELTETDGKYSGIITLSEVEANTTKTITTTITWTDANTEASNTADTTTGQAAGDIEIPVTVTASQYLG